MAVATGLNLLLTNILNSFNQFDFAGTPCLLDPRFERSVHPESKEPALPRHCCESVIFIAFGWFRSEVDVVRTVRILLETLGLAANSRELLARLEH